ncbi:hypothetical protein QBC36DRAFT_357518 [Triangularia setosa]|uniref:Nephrocystin 3-like N-terminal domain-containing protein n=1 Tax=Triangularia setosa TaxID=2587417 RepID=A0AAN6WE74_9PEZI|nr:hypothetical protein QBC36DRAFT_357518 [Podospora setosa]
MRDSQKYLAVCQWMQVPSCTRDHKEHQNVRKTYYNDTNHEPGLRVPNLPAVKTWLITPMPRNPFLRIHAIPGAGLVSYYYDEIGDKGEVPLQSKKLRKHLFQEILLQNSSTAQVYSAMDGLDECPKEDREKTVQLLIETVSNCDSKNPGKVRLLVFNRDEPDIKSSAVNKSSPPSQVFKSSQVKSSQVGISRDKSSQVGAPT